MGIATSGSIDSLLPEALPRERAGLLAVVYAISYTGSAVPSLIAGQVSRIISLPAITAAMPSSLPSSGSAHWSPLVTRR
jgi:hypothetical protein